MLSRRLNALDASWLYVESADAPMHVGGLMIFQLPDGAAPDFCQRLADAYRKVSKASPPWNLRLRFASRLKRLTHVWDEVGSIDTHFHLRSSAVAAPGNDGQLSDLVARLHRHPLALDRPPWECHVIEGLAGGRFALYVKIHHSLIDGVSAMRLLDKALAKDAGALDRPPFWAMPKGGPAAASGKSGGLPNGAAPALLRYRRHLGQSLPALARAARSIWMAGRDNTEAALSVPFKAPPTLLNGRIGGARSFAMHVYSKQRVTELAKAADCTVNDVILACCGSALRRFLQQGAQLPARSLTAGIPVSVRPREDDQAGNAITFMIASLGTDVSDPAQRLQAIRRSTLRAKQHLGRLPREAMTAYTTLLLSPYMAQLLSGMAGRTRPAFNLTVSNVPGPKAPLYLRGAPMVANFPVSLVTHGQALNITCHGYTDSLCLGFVGCRDTVPELPRLAGYAGDALVELEHAVARGAGAFAPASPQITGHVHQAASLRVG